MRRFVARFEDDESASSAKRALQEAGFSPERPSIDNPFFDPSANVPEARWLRWGSLAGGVVGAAVLYAMVVHALWLPRISPIMTAGRYTLVALGFGLGAIVGGFLGGVVGTWWPVGTPSGPRLAVDVPDDRTGEVEELLEEHGATAVDDAVTHHEYPMAERAASSDGDAVG